jgi:class 3 adenylate cyclase
VRAAADLQRRCVETAVGDPAMPLLVGVGLDIGEPAEAGGGSSGGALNVAARLCARAAPGPPAAP